MPSAITGTNIFDWTGNKITSGYTVIQPGLINSSNQNPLTDSNISLEFDKTSAAVGDIVKATLSVNNIENFAGYQVNLKYDPAVLQPVTASGTPFSKSTVPSGATILTNEDYYKYPMASHNISEGILCFSNTYTNLEDYKASGIAETTGTLAVISFKVLQGKATTVSFEDSRTMPNGITGTILCNWNAERISGYTVNQAGILNTDGQQIVNGNISLDIDKTTASVGDIINATVRVNGISNFAGYQVNLTYDPTVLKPVNALGQDYTNSTIPTSGTLLGNYEYGPYPVAAHNLSGGILNFGKSYTNLEAYRASGSAETSGTLAVISFKVLTAKSTAVLFENSASMANGISGTMLFDWNGDKLLSGYTVTQPAIITVNGNGDDVDDTSCIKLDLDKTTASVGDIISATLKVEGMADLAGYQVNLKYDPAVLQPVNPATGVAYAKSTNPTAGDLLNNSDYGVLPMASHDLEAGILNFSRSYTSLEDYRTNGNEGPGKLAVIGFKVLKQTATSITFENSGTMPSAIIGTMLFDSYGNKINSGYDVIQPGTINADSQDTTPSYITMNFDKTSAAVGDTVKATLSINNIDNFAGYQVNLNYDPEVLQPVTASGVAYTNNTIPTTGEMLSNQDYGILPIAYHDLTNGVLNFSKSYTNLEDYRLSGSPEKTGTLAVISFKVLKVQATSVSFASTNTMPHGIDGTMLFDWDAKRIISGYKVIQPNTINSAYPTGPIVTPTKTVVVTPTKTVAVTPTKTTTPTPTETAIVTPTKTATQTPTKTATPTATIAVPTPTSTQTSGESYITIDFDKTTAKVNDTIKATVRISNIDNFSGYQASLKYDPTVLQPITSSGTAYTNSSIPLSGTILTNGDYGTIPAASHNITAGKLNFGKLYTNLEDYRASGIPEETGTVAVINFKVLAESATSVIFENSTSMPNGINGTMLFDWYGDRIKSGYTVIQPAEINAGAVPTITVAPSKTPVVTPTSTKTATPTPTQMPSNYITVDFDKTTAAVGETITATVRVNKISNFSGYQLNLKYDPAVLQPIKSSGASYTNSSIPAAGTLIANSDYGPVIAVSHNLTSGLLNFGKLYTNIEEYRASGSPEETGTIAVIQFKVLASTATTLKFENSTSMPNGIDGTMLFDWDGNRITSGYSVIQPAQIN